LKNRNGKHLKRVKLPGKELKYPGIQSNKDGSEAVVWVETNITQGGCAYPITTSEKLYFLYKLAASNEQKNLWNEPLFFIDSESEYTSASTCEGYAVSGGRVTNFTSGQGLVLMKEALHTIAGKRMPCVFHVGARALTSQGINTYAGHDDVMAVSDCGWGMLFAKNVQEAADLALIARRTAEDTFTPFLNIQDGFTTTHTKEDILLPEKELMIEFIDNPVNKLVNLFDTAKPIMTGVLQKQDSYMKGRIAQRDYYEKIPGILKNVMDRYYELTGRRYGMIEKYMLDDAEYAIVGLGNGMVDAVSSAKWLREKKKIKAGVLNVTCYRPFPKTEIVKALSHTKAFTVIERTDNPLAGDNPLTMEIKSAFADAWLEEKLKNIPGIYSCVFGLGGRAIKNNNFEAIINNMMEKGKRFFVTGIEHGLSI
jgi:pyruvate-ferredoxin/flavodoxin oxidoreductase